VKRVISGIQATGNIHLGNYLGAIRHWVNMQEKYECFYFLADLHAITIPQNPNDLLDSIYKSTAALLASGVDISKTVLFAQSDVKEHPELAWILNCMTPIGWLGRMTQFKDKSGKNEEKASCGLFSYPVLMAADILLYKPELVPVGEDQKQHLELTRDIVNSVNAKFKKEILTVPECLIQGAATRVMSLRDGSKKMSKSDSSDMSRIHLSDSKDEIINKLKKAKTDSLDYISYEESRPEIKNLLVIFSEISERSIDSIVSEYQNTGFGKFKSDLAEIVAEHLSPINTEYNRLIQDKNFLKNTLKIGADKARKVAAKTLYEIKEEFGFINNKD
jgi:tryptophanyl-tRNA synthetase